MLNTDTHAPVFHGDLAYDANLSPTLRGIWVNAPGVLFVVDINDVPATFTFAANDFANDILGSDLPKLIEAQIKRIVGDGSGNAGDGSTGTNIALADLVGIR